MGGEGPVSYEGGWVGGGGGGVPAVFMHDTHDTYILMMRVGGWGGPVSCTLKWSEPRFLG